MCYELLVDRDVDRPVSELLREELPSALENAAVAAILVLGVLLLQGTGLALVALSVLGTVALAVVLHELVLLAGVHLVRLHARASGDVSYSVG